VAQELRPGDALEPVQVDALREEAVALHPAWVDELPPVQEVAAGPALWFPHPEAGLPEMPVDESHQASADELRQVEAVALHPVRTALLLPLLPRMKP